MSLVEELRGKSWPVLDQGWVRLADVMGSDQTICDRARGTVGGDVKRSSDRDLIRLMLRHNHGSSFEFPEIDVQLCTPFIVWRQQIRHRAGNIMDEMTMWDEPSVNELSGRYSVLPESIQATAPDQWRRQSKANRQGSGGNFLANDGATFSAWESEATRAAIGAYKSLIANGVAKEQARKVWPMGGYTVGFVKMDLRNWLHWLTLRLADDAQEEIRAFAQVIAREVVAPLFPMTWEAFCDYSLHSIRLSRLEIEAIRSGQPLASDNKREQAEWADKAARLGLNRQGSVIGDPAG